MDHITSRNMSQRLVEAIPELESAYATELSGWNGEDPGPHNVYSAVLVPYIASLARSGGHEELLGRIFAFLETLAKSSSEDVLNVVGVTVVEELVGIYPDLVAPLRPFMGPKTADVFNDLEQWLEENASR